MNEVNAKIKSTQLGYEGHNILTAWLHLEYNGGGQGFGGYCLGGPYLTLFLERVLKVVGVESWEDLPGHYVKARQEHSKVHEIAGILSDDWFNPKEEFASIKKQKEEEGA